MAVAPNQHASTAITQRPKQTRYAVTRYAVTGLILMPPMIPQHSHACGARSIAASNHNVVPRLVVHPCHGRAMMRNYLPGGWPPAGMAWRCHYAMVPDCSGEEFYGPENHQSLRQLYAQPDQPA